MPELLDLCPVLQAWFSLPLLSSVHICGWKPVPSHCVNTFCVVEMYFRNVTNYPIACNHSSSDIIGVSCKYLIKGLGEWGGWEAWRLEAFRTCLALEALWRHRGPLRQQPEEGHSQAAQGLWRSGSRMGPGPSRSHTHGLLRPPCLMGTNCTGPPSSGARACCAYQAQMAHTCEAAPHSPSAQVAELLWSLPGSMGTPTPGEPMVRIRQVTEHTASFSSSDTPQSG